jgi:hypothetical protein
MAINTAWVRAATGNASLPAAPRREVFFIKYPYFWDVFMHATGIGKMHETREAMPLFRAAFITKTILNTV